MKKLFAILILGLVCVLSAACFIGCGQSNNGEIKEQSGEKEITTVDETQANLISAEGFSADENV
ncbi:MAG: hypothetical protein IJU83_01320 [Clostridia bacterium]|nr:hypothetical protein [Clostridia bacterium]